MQSPSSARRNDGQLVSTPIISAESETLQHPELLQQLGGHCSGPMGAAGTTSPLKKPAGFHFVLFHPEPRKVITQHLLDSAISVASQNTHTIFYIATVKFCPSIFSLLGLYLRVGPKFQIVSQARFC